MSSPKFHLMQQALSLAETCMAAIASKEGFSRPDTTSWNLGLTILAQGKQLLPDNAIVQSTSLDVEMSWTALRSAMLVVGNACSMAGSGSQVLTGRRSLASQAREF